MDKLTDGITRFLEGAMILLMSLMVINVTWQVAARNLLGNPSSFTEEVARFLFIWIGLLGAAYAYRKKMHLSFDLVFAARPPRQQYWLELFIHLLIALFSLAVLVFGGLRLVIMTFELGQVSASLQMNLGYVYLALPLTGLIVLLYAADFIRKRMRGEAGFFSPNTEGEEI